jgi:uncharacterized protein YuzE
VHIEYDADVDTLYLRFKDGVSPTHSEDDAENGGLCMITGERN